MVLHLLLVASAGLGLPPVYVCVHTCLKKKLTHKHVNTPGVRIHWSGERCFFRYARGDRMVRTGGVLKKSKKKSKVTTTYPRNFFLHTYVHTRL
jgi:hypothetical protein